VEHNEQNLEFAEQKIVDTDLSKEVKKSFIDYSVSVIVSAENLQAAQTAQIFNIVYETTGITPEKVSIVNKK
jgi:hypothetical protein